MLFRRIDDDTAATARLRVAQLSSPVGPVARGPRHAVDGDDPPPSDLPDDPPEWIDPETDRESDPPLAGASPGWVDRLGIGRRVRLDPGRSGATALVVTAIVSAVLAALVTWLSRPSSGEVAPVTPAANSAPSTSVASSASADASAASASAPGSAPPVAAPTSPDEIVVSVVGKVAKPGLVVLPTGARVADALQAAGGALPGVDTTTLNLARRLADGEQVAVGVAGAESPAAAPPGSGSSGASGDSTAGAPASPVNLNSATLAELEELPGVGPVIAQHILDYRDTNGPFQSTDQLQEVSGIGPATFAKLADLVTV